ncbi:MAG: cation:proton antiporter [Synergistetes bacterium]|nr:cation:proton antiporter [Synergistota bacterium]MDW8191718.1 cation:proton antiporter [Synergistota bacterium]
MNIFLKIAVILLSARFCGYLATRVKLPEAFGALLGGVIIGPILGIVELSGEIRILADLGVVFLLFLAGLETNVEELRRVGIPSFVIASAGVIVPLFVGYWISLLYGYPKITALFLGGTLTATSVGLTTSILLEMKKLHTKEGTAILASAIIDDVLGIMVLAIIIAIKKSGHVSLKELSFLSGEVGVYFLLSYLLGSPLIKKTLKLMEKLDLPEVLTSVIIALMLIFAYLAEGIKIAAITGAYLAGLIISKTPEARRVEDKINTLAFSLFVPTFLVGIGASTNIYSLSKTGAFTIIYFIIAVLTKIAGCGVGALITKSFTFKEALKIGVGMIPRMEVGLVIANMALLEGIFDDSAFATAVTMTLLTTIITPPLLKWTFSKG